MRKIFLLSLLLLNFVFCDYVNSAWYNPTTWGDSAETTAAKGEVSKLEN